MAIFKSLLLLIAGIAIGTEVSLGLFESLSLFFGLLVFCLIAHFRWKNSFVDFSVGLLVFVLGICLAKAHDHRAYSHHYTNLIPIEKVENDTIVLRITEVQKPTLSARYVAKVEQINSQLTFGKVLIYAPFSSSLEVDDRLLTVADIKPIASPKNPFQFDYQDFLKKRNIFGSVRVKDSSFFKLTPAKTVIGEADNVRKLVLAWMKPWQLNEKA